MKFKNKIKFKKKLKKKKVRFRLVKAEKYYVISKVQVWLIDQADLVYISVDVLRQQLIKWGLA